MEDIRRKILTDYRKLIVSISSASTVGYLSDTELYDAIESIMDSRRYVVIKMYQEEFIEWCEHNGYGDSICDSYDNNGNHVQVHLSTPEDELLEDNELIDKFINELILTKL